MSVNAGSVFVRLGGLFDRRGFDEFEANTVKAQKVKDIKARLGGEFDSRDFDLYQKRLDETRERTRLRGAIKATLGADYDSRAFNAYYRDLVKARAATAAADKDTNLLTRSFQKLTASAGGAGGALGGGGGGLGGVLPGVSGGFLALVGVVSTLFPVLLAVAGAATALAGSLAAAAAGAAAVGVGIGAALGPLAVVAGAVAVRVAAMTDAFRALGTQQTKGGDQAKASGEAQYQAAQRITQAQVNLTKARFTARREVEDLTAAVIRSTLAEQDAAIALRTAQESAAGTIADPRSTQLQRDQARQDVKDARQRASDAVTERQRAITDERRGTDTLRQAELQLAQARHSATIAAQREGASATDAREKLGQLSATERRLVVDFKAFVDQLTAIFKPATDAIFGSVDRALRLITPLIGGFKQRFEDLGIDIGGVVDRAAKAFTGQGWTDALNAFVTTAQKIVKPIGDSVGSVLLILRNIAVATQPYVVELANNIRDALGGLADKTKDPQKVRDVIKGLVDQTKSWLGFMSAVARLIFTIFSGGARQGQGLLDQMTAIVNKWTAFLGTEEGQRKMRQFFRDSIELTKKVAGFLGDVVDAFYRIGHFLLEHTNLIKAAALAWVGYKAAAVAAGLAAKGVAVASFIRGPAAAGAGGPAASTVASGAAGTVAGAGRGAFAGGLLRGGLYGAAAVGGITALTQAIKGPSGTDVGLVNRYADALERVVKTGDRQGMRDLARQFRETASANQDLTKGENLKRFADALDSTASRGDRDISAIADAFSKLPPSVGGNIEKVRRDLGQLANDRALGTVNKALQNSADNFADWRRTGSNNLAGLHIATAENMQAIKRSLGEDSAAGKDALVGNFRLAEQAIRDAMSDGKVSTRDGLREIRRLMKEELAVYGITGQQATDYLRVSGKGSGNEGPGYKGGYADGGWIGAPGMVGTDTVPAMLAPGEAVLNRHQQAVIEGMLGGGFLDNLFANVQTPHYFAQGGRVGGVQPAVASLGNRLTNMFGLQVTSTTGGTHAPGSYHYQGLAEDLGGSEDAMARASAYLMSSGAYKSLLEGIHKPGLSVKDGKTVPSSFWGGVWDQHANHIHIALRALGAITGASGSMASRIRTPNVIGGGALGKIVHGGLARAASGARDRVSAIVAGLGGGDTVPAGAGGRTSAGGKYNKSQLERLWISAGGPPGVANIAAAIALAESGGNPSIVNSIGATGLWQIYNGNGEVPGAKNPSTNARMAVAKYKGAHGFTPWTTYTGADTPNHEKTYLRYLARGGFARRALRFASGGRVPSATGGSPQPTGGSAVRGRTNISQLAGTQRIRVKAYDDLTTSISDEERRYGQAERRYNQSGEVLIDPVTGEVNKDAVERRAGELAGLMRIRQRILDYLERQLTIARRVVKTYTTIIGRLTRSLKHARGKDRAGVRADIAAYSTERDTWRTNVKNVGFDVGDARLDIGDLQKEGAELRGTTADTSIASTAGSDTGFGDTGSGAGDSSAASNPDVDAIIAQIQQRADNAAANLVSANQVIAAFSSSGDIGMGGSSAFNAVANEGQPVGAQFAPAGSLGQRSATVNPAPEINIYTLHPGDPATLRAVGDAATAGQSLQASVSASKTSLGI